MIDPATNFIELHNIPNKRSYTASRKVDAQWLCCYPRPLQCIYDNDNEFLGKEFKELLDSYGIAASPTTVRNPQANAILEHVHAVINNHLRFLRTLDPKKVMPDEDPWENILQSISWAINSTVHSTTNMTPGQLVFNRDMILHTTHVANWEYICCRKQHRINYNNDHKNKTRVLHVYTVGDRAYLMKDILLGKNEPDREGPYEIIDVNANSTVAIRRGAIIQTVNIYRLVLHF